MCVCVCVCVHGCVPLVPDSLQEVWEVAYRSDVVAMGLYLHIRVDITGGHPQGEKQKWMDRELLVRVCAFGDHLTSVCSWPPLLCSFLIGQA